MGANPIPELTFGAGEVAPQPPSTLRHGFGLAHAVYPFAWIAPPPARFARHLPRFAGEGRSGGIAAYVKVSPIVPKRATCPLSRDAGEGWGGGIRRDGTFAATSALSLGVSRLPE